MDRPRTLPARGLGRIVLRGDGQRQTCGICAGRHDAGRLRHHPSGHGREKPGDCHALRTGGRRRVAAQSRSQSRIGRMLRHGQAQDARARRRGRRCARRRRQQRRAGAGYRHEDPLAQSQDHTRLLRTHRPRLDEGARRLQGSHARHAPRGYGAHHAGRRCGAPDSRTSTR